MSTGLPPTRRTRQEIARLDTVGITLERVALIPLPLFRELAQAEAIARTVANSGERCLLGGFIHSSNWDAAAMENLLCSAAAGIWIWICISMRSSAKCLRG